MYKLGISSDFGLENHGLHNLRNVYWNLSPAELIEHTMYRKEGELSNLGALVVQTGIHTGRSPHDKYFVQNNLEEDQKVFWSADNKPISSANFNILYKKVIAYLQGRDVYVQDMQVGAHHEYNLPIRVVSELPSASLLANNLFIRLSHDRLLHHIPEFTVLHCPNLKAIPDIDGTISSTFIAVDLSKKMILIGDSGYAGEIKKSLFTIMNYVFPLKNIMTMHCSANVDSVGKTALFFGLSGTGKTTLSSDPERRLVGDDEHGWGDDGIFNFEGGCYAKTIRLNPRFEPVIYGATGRFGAMLENVIIDPISRIPDFDDGSITENTRAAYPIHFIDNFVPEGCADHPKDIFFLTADAFGVMPPISKLTLEQAIYYFLSGYTSKLAGTEVGLGKEPQATFSMCFGAPFMPLSPHIYATLLREKIRKHQTDVWLINTGWTGGPYGIGKRFELPYTRAMIRAVLTGQLKNVPMHQEPYFGLWIPDSCAGVPTEILKPQKTWSDIIAYEEQTANLIQRYQENEKQFEGIVSKETLLSGPHLERQ
ncbi:MAG: phosphoenolpyruvate carboxykinase (ATP) [Anaerolineaceae bacterium]|nr:phosphoenolpyruvate carboxykinase (ATP) [Anaerolineaceae bacterium]